MKDQAEKLRLYYFENESNYSPTKKIFSFTSGKGGTGKTFLALNIAYALARQQKKILLVDFDFNLASIHLMLNVNPLNTITDFFIGEKPLSDAITNLSVNVDAIFGESGSTTLNQLPGMQLNLLFEALADLAKDYDYILMDTGAGANASVVNILKKCDENIFVVTTDPTSVMDAYVLMKFLYQNSGKNLFPVLINKCSNEEDGKQTFEKLEIAVTHFLNVELVHVGSINYSDEIRESVIDQKLFINSNILSIEAEQILSSAVKINEYHQLANSNHALNSGI